MTPADLAELLKTTAAAVLAEHGLDAAALPATVTVERPRNPEHGDYATNLALQLGKKVGANPRELAGWLADALTDADGIAAADVAGPGFVNLRIEASAQGVIVDNVIAAGAGVRPLRRPRRARTINLEFVSANPTGPDPHRRHPLGRRRRRAGPAADHPGRRRRARVLLQRPRRPDRPVHQLADRRGQGRARRPRTATRATTSTTSPPRCSSKAPDALSLPDDEQQETFRAIGVDLMFTHIKAVAARVRHRLRRLHPRRLDAHLRPGRAGHRQAARDRQHLREGRRNLAAHHRLR